MRVFYKICGFAHLYLVAHVVVCTKLEGGLESKFSGKYVKLPSLPYRIVHLSSGCSCKLSAEGVQRVPVPVEWPAIEM